MTQIYIENMKMTHSLPSKKNVLLRLFILCNLFEVDLVQYRICGNSSRSTKPITSSSSFCELLKDFQYDKITSKNINPAFLLFAFYDYIFHLGISNDSFSYNKSFDAICDMRIELCNVFWFCGNEKSFISLDACMVAMCAIAWKKKQYYYGP